MGVLTAKRSADSLFTMWSLLEQAYSLLYRNLDRHMAKAGVSQSQVSVLLGLKAIGHALPLSRIGSLRALQAASVTALVDRLEQRGLVRRVRTSLDRRVVNLELTSDGDALCEQLYPRELVALTDQFVVLDSVEFHNLMQSLRTLRNRGADIMGINRAVFDDPIPAGSAELL